MTDKTDETKKPNYTLELIKRLSSAVGVSGYSGTNNVHDVITAEMTPYADRVERDRMGSVIGFKAGQADSANARRYKIMLAAHLDEIGAIVTKVDRGFLRFNQIGGLDNRLLMGQEVMVHCRQHDLPGVIGAIPPHFLRSDQPNNEVDRAKMHIDVGLYPAQLKQVAEVGDLVSFARPPAELLNGLISAKAMDNRSSVAVMVVCLRELNKLHHQWDVYAVATADEEWGSFVGAVTQSYAIRPDVAIVVDVTFADVDEIEVKLDGGPVITLGPGNHPVVREHVVKLCAEMELKYQSEALPRGAGTDAFAIEISREGIPTLLISIPSRYMHSPVEVVSVKDVERTGRLIANFIASLDENFTGELIPKI